MSLAPDQAKIIFDALLPQFKAEYKTTLRVLQAVPADKGEYRPDERSMTALDLAWHIASADIFFMHLASKTPMQGDGTRPAELANGPAVAAFYAENFPKALTLIENITGEQLVEEIEFHTFKTTALGYLQLNLVHGVHHRGQLSAYLRPMGAKVPSIYGGSADEPMSAAASN